MEARLCRLLFVLAALFSLAAAPTQRAGSYRTPNFVVTAPTPEIAKQVGEAAEVFRREIAIDWLGQELPPWYAPCPIKVKVGQIGAGGQTTFSFHPSPKGPDEVCGWDMQIQGSLERILDSVLPHEISHTIFACYFRRPLPRWADEGAATLIEHDSERQRQIMTVRQVIRTQRRIPLKTLLSMKEYPKDMRDVMTLYAEGYSLAELLVQQGGKPRYLKFLNDAHQRGWEQAIQMHYDYRSVDDLEKKWHDWIITGSPSKAPAGRMLAKNASPANETSGRIVRGQSPDSEPSPELLGDPFLDAVVAMAEPVRRGDKVDRQPVRRPRIDRSGLNRDWVAEEDGEPQAARTVAAADAEEATWVDAPRSSPRARERIRQTPRAPRRSQPFDESGAAEEATRPASRPLPSSVTQRQAESVPLPIYRGNELSAEGRTRWSEFPQDLRPVAIGRSSGEAD